VREGVYDQAAIERLDDELDCGKAAVMGDLGRIARANIDDEVESFAQALETGLILPEDF